MKHRPFPEIVTGERDWEVYEDTKQPRTDMTNKKCTYPLMVSVTNVVLIMDV